jgi:hypothetical protein
MPGDIPDAVGAVLASAACGVGLPVADAALAGRLAVAELRRCGWTVSPAQRPLPVAARQEPLRELILGWLEQYAPEVSVRDAEQLVIMIEGRRTTSAARTA